MARLTLASQYAGAPNNQTRHTPPTTQNPKNQHHTHNPQPPTPPTPPITLDKFDNLTNNNQKVNPRKDRAKYVSTAQIPKKYLQIYLHTFRPDNFDQGHLQSNWIFQANCNKIREVATRKRHNKKNGQAL